MSGGRLLEMREEIRKRSLRYLLLPPLDFKGIEGVNDCPEANNKK